VNEQIANILADPAKYPVFTSNADEAYSNIQALFRILTLTIMQGDSIGGMESMSRSSLSIK
jgi:MFS-type transporter involved in bile tolerance (Atg22 family)